MTFCMCGYDLEQCICNRRLEDQIQNSIDEYYGPKIKTILVPVEVSYHDATDIVYSFKAPTIDDVEKALKNSYKS